MSRIILHLDLDAFFCSVEERYDSSLAGVPFAVGGSAENRGVISTCSYAARKFGVRSAMSTAQAFKLCPELLLLPVRHRVYSNVSRRVLQYVYALSPLVEQISIDEAFADLTDVATSWKDAENIARTVQYRIRKDLELPASIGIAANKLVAKMATEEGKAAAKRRGQWDSPPSALVVVPPGTELEFLAPQPIDALWGVGPKMAEKLRTLGISTLGELAAYPQTELVRRWGKSGLDLSRRARGLDDRPVTPEREIKSVSKETTFARDVREHDALIETLSELVAGVSEALARKGYQGNIVKLKIRWPDFSVTTRQQTLVNRTADESILMDAAVSLLTRMRPPTQPVRLIGVGMSGLRADDGHDLPDTGQMRLFDDSAL